jgi:hypothetical protein
MGWTYAFPNRCELEKLCGLYSTGFSSYEISMLQLLRRREVNERLCIEEVGVDPEPLCSCPWTRCGAYHESFLQEYLVIWIILSVSLVWSLAVMVPTRLSLSNVPERNPFQASSIFDKVKVSAIASQRSSSVSILVYLRVLPPGISRISCLCTTSY